MLDDQVAEAAAITANEMTSRTIAITAGDRTIELVPRELRSLARVEQVDEPIKVALQGEDALPGHDPEFGDRPVEPPSAPSSHGGGQVRHATPRPCCARTVTGGEGQRARERG